MDKVRTVSDTKRSFYNHHTHPINSIYRRVVEELMVEMHLLSVNVEFRYDPIFALGVVNSFDRFMQGYQPESDQASIFNALCLAVESDPQTYRQDAERLKHFASNLSAPEIVDWLCSPTPRDDVGDLFSSIQDIRSRDKFKYSRLFAIGLYTLLEEADSDFVKDEKQFNEALEKLSEALHISLDKTRKDLELYRSNLNKIAQAKAAMDDILKADRKRRQQRALEKTQPQDTEDNNEDSNSSEDQTSSSEAS